MNKIQVHFFQHAADEDFGNCKDYLHSLDAQLSTTEFFALPSLFDIELDALPDIENVDLLIVMGSLLQLQDELHYPWLKTEKRWLRRYLARKKPLIALGVGAQVLAQSLGGVAFDRDDIRCGWQQVYAYTERSQAMQSFQMPQQVQVLQWYQQCYALPRGAIALAYSRDCGHQVFQIEQHVLAFQFHPEMTPQRYQRLCEEQAECLKQNDVQALRYMDLNSADHGDDMQTVLMGCKQGAALLQRAIDYVLSYDRQRPVEC